MAANQFSSFGLAGGAYVLSPGAYAALGARTTGFPPGLLPKENLNTPLRQTSFVTTALAQFMADQSALDSNDDGNQATFIANYKIAERNFRASQRLPVETGAGNVYVVALVPAITVKVHGTEVSFLSTHANTGAATLNIGAGASPIKRADGSALQAADLPVGGVVTVIYNQPSDAWFVEGVLINQTNGLAAWRYVTVDTAMSKGSPYLCNTQGGTFNMTLPANPTVGDSFTMIDANNNWGLIPFTIRRNGHTIMGNALDLSVNVNDQMFSMWYAPSLDWRLV